jgi:hypothetical protein
MSEPLVALLIDADNISGAHAAAVVAEAGRHGRVGVRRMYGDWTQQALQKWKAVAADHAIQPIQQFRNTVGKNATDSALIIDAMDLLHGSSVAVFCIVSSDADFTRLASRLRESARTVVGIGQRRTPRSFVLACDRFVYLENLQAQAEEEAAEAARAARVQPARASAPAPALVVDDDADGDDSAPVPALGPLLAQAYEHAELDEGFASLGAIGNQLHRIDPAFDPRNYGFRQLRRLVEAQPGYLVAAAPEGAGLQVRRVGEGS